MLHLNSFEDWAKHQQMPIKDTPKEVVAVLRGEYERRFVEVMAHDPQNVVRHPPSAREYRYAIAIEDGANLWLTLWVRRSKNGSCFIVYPRGPGSRNPHASYHADGKYHHKSYGQKIASQQRQPLDHFSGAEHLGSFGGHGPGSAICYSAAFTSVLRVPEGILESTHGCVLVDLVEPGVRPHAHHREVPGLRIVCEATHCDVEPWVVIAIAAQAVQG